MTILRFVSSGGSRIQWTTVFYKGTSKQCLTGMQSAYRSMSSMSHRGPGQIQSHLWYNARESGSKGKVHTVPDLLLQPYRPLMTATGFGCSKCEKAAHPPK